MTEVDVVRQAAEEGNAVSNEDGHSGDGQAVQGARAQESLNGEAAIDVEVARTGGIELGDDFGGRSCHLFNVAFAYGGQVEGAATENDDALVGVGPCRKGEDGFKSLPADDKRVDASEEFGVAMGLTATGREKVEIAVRPGQEAIDADADKGGNGHGRLLVGIAGTAPSVSHGAPRHS